MLGLGDLLTQVQRKTPVVQIIFNNESLDFVKIEIQEAGVVPFGVDFKNPNFAKVAEAMGAKGIRIEEPGDVRDGLAEALAFHKTRVPLLVFVGGLCGCVGGFSMQYWCAAVSYPVDIAGHPYNSWPMFIPVTFETTILCAALTAVTAGAWTVTCPSGRSGSARSGRAVPRTTRSTARAA